MIKLVSSTTKSSKSIYTLSSCEFETYRDCKMYINIILSIYRVRFPALALSDQSFNLFEIDYFQFWFL